VIDLPGCRRLGINTSSGSSSRGKQLVLEPIPRPVPHVQEVLIRVCAAGMNPLDWKMRQGFGPARPAQFPYIPGAGLSSQQSIRQLADTFRQRYTHLHMLINNAGAGFTQRRESVDGLEMTFVVNYLAPCLSAEARLPGWRMKAATFPMCWSQAAIAALSSPIFLWKNWQRREKMSRGTPQAH
jgi:NAD(P)-dependent dehydrogenase (short-subunit alcohol dehydrogenase family)